MNLWFLREGWQEGIVREFGVDLYTHKCSDLVLWEYLEGAGGEGGGRGDRDGEDM